MTRTFTHTYTRTRALEDQVETFLSRAGIHEGLIQRVSRGVRNRWLSQVGVCLVDGGLRVAEASIAIDWIEHSDVASGEFITDLPGWEGVGSPEAHVLGVQIKHEGEEKGISPRVWIKYSLEISSDPGRRQEVANELGFGAPVPAWKSDPVTRTFPMQDLLEIELTFRRVP